MGTGPMPSTGLAVGRPDPRLEPTVEPTGRCTWQVQQPLKGFSAQGEKQLLQNLLTYLWKISKSKSEVLEIFIFNNCVS